MHTYRYKAIPLQNHILFFFFLYAKMHFKCCHSKVFSSVKGTAPQVLCALLFMVLLKWFPAADRLVVNLYRARKCTINESFLIVTMNPYVIYITKDIERGV